MVCLPAPSVIKPEEGEFVVDSGASMHMLSRNDLNSAELEAARLQKSDDGCKSQRRSANNRIGDSVCQGTGFIRDSDASRRYTCRSTRKSLRRSRALLPLDQWSETTTHQKWQTKKCNTANYAPIVCPCLSTGSSSSFSPTSPTFFTAGSRSSCFASRINKKWECEWQSTERAVAWTSRNRKLKQATTKEYGETRWSSICRGGTRLGNTVDTIIPV